MNDRPMAKDERDHSKDLKHPIGASVGGVAGAVAAGAAMGTLAGPLGTAAGAIAGAVLGGAAIGAAVGSGVADWIVPDDEHAYWRDNFADRAYGAGREFDDFAPAYRFGATSYPRYVGRDFDEVEADLERDWIATRGESTLEWTDARHATRDSWQRLGERHRAERPGDFFERGE